MRLNLLGMYIKFEILGLARHLLLNYTPFEKCDMGRIVCKLIVTY